MKKPGIAGLFCRCRLELRIALELGFGGLGQIWREEVLVRTITDIVVKTLGESDR